MKATRILMAALLLAGSMASCSKDDDNNGSNGEALNLPTFEDLYSYIGRTDKEAIMEELRQAGYEADYDKGTIYAEKGDEYWEFSIGDDVYRADHAIFGTANVKKSLIHVVSMQKDFDNAHGRTSFSGYYSTISNPEGTEVSSEDEMLTALKNINLDKLTEASSEADCANSIVSGLECDIDRHVWYFVVRQ